MPKKKTGDNERKFNKLKRNKIILTIAIVGIFYLFLNQTSALSLSNESIQAKEALSQAEKDIFEMMEKNISINRVNETYQEAFQLFLAQSALEEKGRKADYKLIIRYTSDISSVKKTAIQASDEIKIFRETFDEVGKNTNLSEMNDEYNQIIGSFNDERFEDTIELIKTGYDRISEIQSSQTALNSFYLATSRTIKNFFKENWLRIIIIISLTLFFILIFWNNLKKLRMRMRFNHLMTQKKALNALIQNMQKSYFKTKKLSETEYDIKLKKFKELIRDIDRQIMVLKEEIFKVKKKL